MKGIRRALALRFTRRQVEREVDDEIEFHIAQRAASLVRGGMDPQRAEMEARRRFGDRLLLREQCLDEELPQWRRETMADFLGSLSSDARFAVRSLKRSPWFTVVTLTTLVVGIGAVTAIFSFVYSFYWRPLPFKDAPRMIAVEERRADNSCCHSGVSDGVARHLIRSNRSFERTMLWDELPGDMVVGDQARQVSTLAIDTSFAPMFGIRAQVGRLPSPGEIEAHASVAAISDELWRSAFGADSSVLGRRLRIGNEDLLIIGVLPAGFGFPRRTDALRPLPAPSEASETGMLGKLRAGVSRAEALAEAQAIALNLSRDKSLRIGKATIRFAPEMIDRRANQALPLPSLFIGAAVFLLLIACSNVMNLMLVRATERRAEMAVRSSLGAGRTRLVRLALAEVVALGLLAGVLGTVLSIVLVRGAMTLLPSTAGFPVWLHFGLDARVLAFTIAMVLAVILAVGMTPAREGTRFDLARALKVGGDGGVVSSSVARSARRGLAIQLALSIALFVGAGLFVESYRRISRIDFGYPAKQIVGTTLFFDENRYPDAASRLRRAMELAERAQETPGASRAAVRGDATNALAGVSSSLPASKRSDLFGNDFRVIPDGDTSRAVSEMKLPPRLRAFAVTDDYFEVIGIKPLHGRLFEPTDVPGSPLVMVISQRLADVFWPRQNPIGHTLQRGAKSQPFTIVGVVPSVRDVQGTRQGFVAEPRSDAYYSVRQVDAWYPEVIVGARSSTAAVSSTMTRLVSEADRQLVSRPRTLGGAEEAQLVSKIFGGAVAIFAIAGLLLSVVGLYGVVAYGVGQRRREIGVRIALGATARDVIQLIVSQSLRFAGAGIIAGLLLAAAIGQMLRMVLFEVNPVDPASYGAAVVIFSTVTFVACYLPARRAAGINPVAALKSD